MPEQYYQDADGTRRSKSSAFCHMVCDQYKVIAIPLGTFYGKDQKHLGDNLVRWAFCKTTEDIVEAGKRLSQ